jgi:glutathione S-transferase
MVNAPSQLIGRSSSHFTRVPRIIAHELGVPLELVVVHDITATDAEVFAGNPALKLPTLRRGASSFFGAENICRALAEVASPEAAARVIWPEQLRAEVSRNAQELVWHAMAAQVQLVFGTLVAKLPPENVYFVKARAGLLGALTWLEHQLPEAQRVLPPPPALSLFEVTLFCLLEHLTFRGTVDLAPFPRLRGMVAAFGDRASARETAYRYDPTPGS